jgi:hypothetical protein
LTKHQKKNKPASGEATIKFTVAFFTDGIAKRAGKVVRRVCWDKGSVYPQANERHQIKSTGNPKVFNSLAEIPTALQKTLIAHRIKVRPGSTSRKYIKLGPPITQ